MMVIHTILELKIPWIYYRKRANIGRIKNQGGRLLIESSYGIYIAPKTLNLKQGPFKRKM